jgi:nitrogen fixation NifU-like protein
MTDLNDLYQEIILDHYAHPHHFGPLADANREAEGYNPLCGDQVHLRLRVEGERIADLAFEGSGCAISTASASAMTDAVAGQSVADALALQGRMLAVLTGADEDPAHLDDLGELAAFAGVRNYPMRVKCATLAWHALREALTAPPLG